MKLTKIQKQAAAINKRSMFFARQELANRNPSDRHEIMAGDWDHGPGIAEVKRDLDIISRNRR